jgi:hypothetical protein
MIDLVGVGYRFHNALAKGRGLSPQLARSATSASDTCSSFTLA